MPTHIVDIDEKLIEEGAKYLFNACYEGKADWDKCDLSHHMWKRHMKAAIEFLQNNSQNE